MSKIKTLTSGVGAVSEVELAFCPEFITYTAATQLQNISVSVLGTGVIMELGADGLDALGRAEQIGQRTNATLLRLADGLQPDKKTTLKFTNSAAQTPDIFAISTTKGRGVFVESSSNNVNQFSKTQIKKFLFASFPNAGASDLFTVTFMDGTTEQMERNELANLLQLQQTVQNSASDFFINNSSQIIKNVMFYPNSGAQTIYTQKLAI